jgi:hypothetical protein
MKSAGGYWLVHNKYRLLLAVMEELACNAHIAFEGDFSGLEIMKATGLSGEESHQLKRQTSSPKLDFVVVPLESPTARTVLRFFGRIGFRRRKALRRIVHVQIEKAGLLEFAAYDNFHPECIFFGDAVRPEFLESLISEGVLTHRPSRKGQFLN